MTITTGQVRHVGFTGTREGMSEAQHMLVHEYLLEICMFPGPKWFHHGDCIGADAQAHNIAKKLGYKIHLHPPIDTRRSAFLHEECDAIDQPWSFHGRNQRIVKACDLLLATPMQSDPELGGGTWYTIEHAKKNKKPVVIFYRDGRIESQGIVRAG